MQVYLYLCLVVCRTHNVLPLLGKYVPSISYKIHNENLLDNPGVQINFQGLAVGNGAYAPENQWVYADYLYEVIIESTFKCS